jgi:selenocysteine lyase/cysteine desulfurase
MAVLTYLDNATTSWPKPDVVIRTLGTFLERASGVPLRPGNRLATETWEAIERVRERLAAFFGVPDPRRVLFTASGTDALNLAIKGLLGPGDHVVTTAIEHDAVRRPLRTLELFGVTTTRVEVGPDGLVDPVDVQRALRPNTRLVIIGHASNVTGALQPVVEIANRAHVQGTLVLVNAAQTAGVIPFTLDDLGADLLALSGHKWLLGPPGTGVLVLGPRVDPSELAPLREGATARDAPDITQLWSLPERYEAGTPNAVGIVALGAALEWLVQEGFTTLSARLRRLTDRLVAGLETIPGVRLLSPSDPQRRVAVISCLVSGWRPVDLASVLEKTYGIVVGAGLHGASEACRTLGAYPHGTVRLSPGWCTTEEDIDRVILAVAELARTPSRAD